ncbi:MAG TPA: hypothetical protein VIK86_00505 [Candidatus Paceibacterota bacterium]
MDLKVLAKFGVTDLAISEAGKIKGILESVELLKKATDEKIAEYSWHISSDITQMLLKKITNDVSIPIKEYLMRSLIFWIHESISFDFHEGISFCTSDVKISESDFKEFKISKKDFVNYLNEIWGAYALVQDSIYFEITSKEGVAFTFKLKS